MTEESITITTMKTLARQAFREGKTRDDVIAIVGAAFDAVTEEKAAIVYGR